MKSIKRNCLIIAIFTLCLMMFSSVYAVGINIFEDGNVNSKFNSNIRVTFKLGVKKYGLAEYTGDLANHVLYPDGSPDYYRTFGILFSKVPGIAYNGDKTGNNVKTGNLNSGSNIAAKTNNSLDDSSYWEFNTGERNLGSQYKLYRINAPKYKKPSGEKVGLDSGDLAIPVSGLQVFSILENDIHTRDIGVSESMIADLKNAGYFSESFTKTVDGQKYYGVFVSVVTTFCIDGSYQKALTSLDAQNMAIHNGMTWGGTVDGKRSGNPVPGKSIFNLYDNILWIKEEKITKLDENITVITHFLENGVEKATYTWPTVTLKDDKVPNTKPAQALVTALKDDSDYDKFTYTKYKIDNGEYKTGNTLDKSAIRDGSIVHVYFERTKILDPEITVITHFLENGQEKANYTWPAVTLKDDKVPNTKPEKSLTTLKNDPNYDKYQYTKYKIDNGEYKTGNTLDKSAVKSGSIIHVYFERTNVNVKYKENGSIKHEKNLVLPGSTPTISRNEHNGAGLDNNYYYGNDVNGGSHTTDTSGGDVKVNITNNSNGGKPIEIIFKYYKGYVTVNKHYIHANDDDEVETLISNQVITMYGGLRIPTLEKQVRHKDKLLNGEINFGYFGGEVKGGRIESFSESKWNWLSPSTSNINITVKPNESTLSQYITVDLYYTARIVDVQLVNASESIIKRSINTYGNRFGTDISVEILKGIDKNIPFIIDETKYFYNGLKSVSASSYFLANNGLNSILYDINKTSTTFAKINENLYKQANGLRNGGDYNIARFKFTAVNPSEVYVRHLVETKDKSNYTLKRMVSGETKYYKLIDVLKNSNQTVKHNLTYYTIDDNLRLSGPLSKNDYELLTPGTVSGYSEYYKIDSTDKLTVEKSRTVYNNGIKYNYLGYSKYNNISNATSAVISFSSGSTTNTECVVSGSYGKTYVDFFYKAIDENPDPDPNNPTPGSPTDPGDPTDPDKPSDTPINPKLYVDPENNGGENISATGIDENSECKVIYVPITEYVRPYLLTKTSSPYTLIYDVTGINKNTGVKTYSLKQYDAYSLKSGYVTNPSTIGEKEARFVATENDGVINASGSFNLTIEGTSSANSTISSFSGLDPKNQTSIDNAVKAISSTIKNNFLNSHNKQQVLETKFNGVRTPKGVAVYDIVGLVGVNQSRVIKSNVNIAASDKNTTKVNVYTPLKLGKTEIKTSDFVDHSVNDLNGVAIPKGTTFTVTPKLDTAYTGNLYNNKINISNYLKNYWIVLDFDTVNVKVYDAGNHMVKDLGNVAAGTKVEVPAGGKMEAKEASTTTTYTPISNIKVIAATKNSNNLTSTVITNNNKLTATSTVTSTGILSVIAKDQISPDSTSCEDTNKRKNHVVKIDTNGDGKEDTDKNILDDGNPPEEKIMESDSLYYAQNTTKGIYIDRIYDLKVTDCLDVNFKNVFRKTNDDNVNESTGIYYFSGIRRLIVSSKNESKTSNVLVSRAESVLNRVSTKTILPLGPVKHIDSSYFQAPKLGYRISFDLKTSGSYTPGNGTTRKIVITPSYYYINKSGTGFNDDITLYYKNSSGKYVSFVGSNYDIYFKPNDGYRAIADIDSTMNISKMSEKLEKLTIGSKNGFTLTESMMSYYQDPSYIQTWYGEFKLPNSTIAVPNSGGDINNPLTGGYIGVKFDIKCIDTLKDGTVITISYNQNNKDNDGNKIPNSTQWDYEGYISMQDSKDFSAVKELRVQLENGIWKIKNQSEYDKMRGTVLLYDTDNRAANDFE